MNRRSIASIIAMTVLGLAVLAGQAASQQSQRFEFGVIGDTPYSAKEEEQVRSAIETMNQADLAFVVHVGDMMADPRGYRDGLPPCTDETFRHRKAILDASKHPMIVTPGDNDWTDCHYVRTNPSLDPLERLTKLREIFFSTDESLGARKLKLAQQGRAVPENYRWSHAGVTFATLHMVGSNNNLGRTPEGDAEYKERNAANIAWMAETFDTAKREGSLAVVLLTQANPGFESTWARNRMGWYVGSTGAVAPAERKPTGFDDFLATLEDSTKNYRNPVLLIHGDTHIFRTDKPLVNAKTKQTVASFSRLETFGSPDVHWVRVTVDPKSPAVFSIQPEIVPANVAPH
jgi:hypothetical protein